VKFRISSPMACVIHSPLLYFDAHDAAGFALPAGANGKVEAWPEGGPAVRRYHAGQNIAYGYLLINPRRWAARIRCRRP
jgi:hypothetical protein